MKYFLYIFTIFIFVLFVSCENQGYLQNEANVRINITCKNLTSRATIDGVDDYNENTINRLDCFIYTEGSTFENEAVFYKHIDVNINTSGTINLNLTNENLETIFGKFNQETRQYPKSECLIYLIANLPNDKELTGEESIADLKSMPIEADFLTFPQTEFVMDSKGDDIVSLVVNDDNSCDLTANVTLYRAASKVALNITSVVASVIVGEDTYYSQPSSMNVYMHYGVNKTHIDNGFDPSYTIEDEDYFSFSTETAVGYSILYDSDNNVVGYEQERPFYSYPTDWSGSDDNKEVYLTLVVPWQKNDESSYHNCYYQIPVNSLGKKLLRNSFYKINLSVGILGSFQANTAVTVHPSYTLLDIEDWNEVENSVTMENYRYLMVQETNHTLRNVEDLLIPYVTSHECTIVVNKFEKYSVLDGKWQSVEKAYQLEIVGDDIHFYNELDNLYTSETFDFAPYRLDFTIKHKDNSSYSETITIIQYPAIYGELDRNTDAEEAGDQNGYVWVNGYKDQTASGNIPNRYINGTGQGFFAEANGLSTNSSGVSSTDMLVFTITSVEGTPYVIGDPRELIVNEGFINETLSNGNSIWVAAPGVEGTESRRLKYYYATDTNNDRLKKASNTTNNSAQDDFYSDTEEAAKYERTLNMIAPKFRIASGYGMIASPQNLDTHYYHLMKKRCASYQEDGYPAGRWRLPTKAEFEFIIYLSFTKKVPELFSTSLQYWCAHGYGQPNTTTKTVNMVYNTYYPGGGGWGGTMISVRCVYDDWYWGSEPVENDEFVWGDEPR